jgi:diguanylate cyclase (GGDEF)-like protein/PAS domain S-box-containing protein
VITTDWIGNIRYLNPVAESLTGWREEEAQGKPLTTVFKIFHETTRIPVENPIEKALREDRIVELANHTILIARDGREISIDDSAAPIHDREGHIVGAVLVFHDVTHNRELSRQFFWQAKHDSLTGLINRREFEQRLEEALTIARMEHQVHALCYMDLDQFKIVNDTCGHVAGDELLRQVTMLLQEQIRKTDTLARLGGDEFGVLLMQCSLDQAIVISNTLREKVQAFRFIWQGNSFAIGVSIGLVEIRADSENLANLLIAADTACYAAKNNGRNRIHVFKRDDQDLLQHQGEIRWVNRLTRALEEDRFVLQGELMASIAPTGSHEEHYEVLLRLQDEAGVLVSPMAFIPAAERYNLMVQIDRWVIKKIFSNWLSLQNKRPDQTHSVVYAINLSGSSINDDQFTDFLHQQFALYAVPPELICFEITETVAIANLSKASLFIDQLQQLGCRFALDDFGSGMSSFAYLKNLPVNYLKIDGGFIKNMVNDPVDYAMVEAINHIGHVMGIKTIAEWVEDDVILERVKALGIDYAQGYAMGKTRRLC